MSDQSENPVSTEDEKPWGQRLFDRPLLLLVLGVITMFVFYTIWGMIEIYSLPQARLP